MDFKLIDRIIALGNLIGHAGLAYIEADNALQVSSWNRGATELFGHTEDDAMGRMLNELIPVDTQALINCNRTQFLPCPHAKDNGQEVQYTIFYAPIINKEGQKLGVAVLARDIADAGTVLKHQEQQLKEIIGFAPIGIYQVNMDGKIISANPEYAWMLGYESAEAVVEQITDFAAQTFFDPTRSEEFMFGLYEAEEVIRFRCRLKRKDNSFVWAFCFAKATHDDSGRRNGFNGFSIDISDMVRIEQELTILNEKFQALSVIDGLTQIPNRRRFDECIESEWNRHCRDKKNLSVILCDIDFFKLYNDTYGHPAGDECLKKVARAIYGCAHRSADLVARYGGEEFVLVLPGTDAKGAMTVAENVRTAVKGLEIIHGKSKVDSHITLSLGVATQIPETDNSAEDLVAQADQALYEAKEKGRNQSISKCNDE